MRFKDVYIIMKFEKSTDVRLKLVLSSQKTYSFDIFLFDNDAKDVVLSQQYHHFFCSAFKNKILCVSLLSFILESSITMVKHESVYTRV